MLQRYWSVLVLLLLLALGAVAQLTPMTDANAPWAAPAATSTPPPACGPAWRVVTSPSPAGTQHTLRGLAALASDNLWAAGYSGGLVGPAQTLVEHWDGSTWSLVPSPNGSSGHTILLGIVALAPDNIWAVGQDGTQTLTIHWTGLAWTVVPSPSIAQSTNWLYGVTALAANDIWAVGYYGTTTGDSRTLILHWDGSTWSLVPSPNVGTVANELYAVTAVAANDVWAVGGIGSWGSRERTLSLHWDGVSWAVIENPNTPLADYSPYAFYGVSGRAPGDVWAVGAYRNNSWSQTLIEHWNGQAWSILPSPNGNLAGDNDFYAVVARAADDAWAVGVELDNGGSGEYHPLIAHWDGSAWSASPAPYPGSHDDRLYGVVAPGAGAAWAEGQQGPDYNVTAPLVLQYADPCSTPSPTASGPPPTGTPTPTPPACIPAWSVVVSPNSGTGDNPLRAVAGVSPTDQWAVGSWHDANTVEQTLILHWDGSAWTVVASPNGGTGVANRLYGVTALAANDVWAVGDYAGTAGQQTLILHWDGSAWTAIASPNPGTTNSLYAVTAVAANDLWAVGTTTSGSAHGPLLLHGTGSSWSVVPGPAGTYTGSDLLAVSAVAANDVWAVGTIDSFGYPDTLTLHWDGSAWTRVPSPSPGGQYDDALTGVTALASNNVWAVGYTFINGVIHTLTLQWDGTVWTVVVSPNVGSGQNALSGVAAGAANQVWAVGSYTGAVTQTLALRWDGSQWGLAAAPSPGAAARLAGVAYYPNGEVWAVGAQQAAVGAPEQPLVLRYISCALPATPTTTATPPGSATPSATATRTASPPPSRTVTPTLVPPSPTACPIHFTDVQPTDYFYTPVRYLACRGVISGYNNGDGTVSFRPYNNTTRSQMVKIVVLGFAKPISTPAGGTYTFADVPPTHPFFAVVETAAAANVVSGYTCGGPGEPCDSANRPYFRPYANVTRGQLAKITVVAAGWTVINPPGPGTFTDVLPGTAFYSFVQTAYCRGVISGYACGGAGEPCDSGNRPYFRQAADATRGQIAKIVYLALTGPGTCAPATGVEGRGSDHP
ncbi:MAG TPA: S-layer homology domain-containing protein [Chloroflexia bacterium]|nr:S-layer homology domain-containing protein [Chloroflexia bacterium]